LAALQLDVGEQLSQPMRITPKRKSAGVVIAREAVWNQRHFPENFLAFNRGFEVYLCPE
jgi:hypothetical protein